MTNPTLISTQGRDLVKHFEGLNLQTKGDPIGIPTVGYGHTRTAKTTRSITKEQADQLLDQDLSEAGDFVNNLVKVPISQNQFDALVSFTFNVGPGALKKSTLLKKLNSGNYVGASEEFKRWKFAGGQEFRGLVRRRKAEKELFNSGPQPDGQFTEQRPSDVFAKQIVPRIADPEESSILESLWAARRESPIIKAFEGPDLSEERDTTFNPLDDIEGYEAFAEDFLHVPTPEAATALKQYIDETIKENQKIQGLSGILGSIGFGILSPTTLIPGIGLASKPLLGAKVLTRVATGAGLAGGALLADEAALHHLDPTRTQAESLFNTVGAAALGGTLLGILGRKSVATKILSKDRRKVFTKALQDDIPAEIRPSTVGAREVPRIQLSGEELVKSKSLNTALKVLRNTSPKTRLLTSQFPEVRKAANKLFEHDFILKKNLLNEASDISLEAAIKTRTASVHRVIADLDIEYKNYLGSGKTDLGTSRIDFEKAVYQSVITGRKPINKFVASAKKIVDLKAKDILNRLKAVQILPDTFKAHNALLTRFEISNILSARSKFERLITTKIKRQFPKIPQEEASELSSRLTDNIVTGRVGPLEYLKIKDDVLDLSGDDLDEFLNFDLVPGLTRFIREAETDIQFKNTFGEKSLNKTILDIKDKAIKGIETKPKKEQLRLLTDLDKNISDIEAIRDILQQRFKLPDDPYSFSQGAMRASKTASFMALGGGIALSQIPDLANVIMRVRLPRLIGKELLIAGRLFKKLKLSKNDLLEIGVGSETWLSSRASELGDVTDLAFRQSRLDKLLNKGINKFLNVTLINQMNDFTRRLSANHIAKNLLEDMQKALDGTLSPSRLTALRRLGFNDIDIKKALKEFSKHAYEEQGVAYVNMSKWGKRGDLFRTAVRREVDSTILFPDAADRSLWMRSSMGNVVSQFTGFGFAMQNKILLPGFQKMDQEFASRLLLLSFLGSVSVMAKDMVKGRNPLDRDLEDLVVAGIDRGGATGLIFDIHNRIQRFTGLGVTDLFGVDHSNKFSVRGRWSTVLGPSAGLIEDVVSTLPGVFSGNPTEGEIKRLRRAMPGQNIFYLQWLMNQIDKQIEKELPKKRRKQ